MGEPSTREGPDRGQISPLGNTAGLMAARRRLPDYIRPGLRILFVGINPGLRSAAVGHHFAGHSNRFWKLLAESRLVPEPLSYREDSRLPEFGLGLTNIVSRPSRGIDSLRPKDYQDGRKALIAKVKKSKPRIVALLGVTIYRALFATVLGKQPRRIPLGLAPTRLAGIPVFVLSNPSGRNAHVSYMAMRRAFCRLERMTRPN